eukprot:4768221-Lingulodinium_polyedra.AAC.1
MPPMPGAVSGQGASGRRLATRRRAGWPPPAPAVGYAPGNVRTPREAVMAPPPRDGRLPAAASATLAG